MDEVKFKATDLVQLLSGGPPMLVMYVIQGDHETTGNEQDQESVFCHWFVGNALKHANFKAKFLKPYDKKDERPALDYMSPSWKAQRF